MLIVSLAFCFLLAINDKFLLPLQITILSSSFFAVSWFLYKEKRTPGTKAKARHDNVNWPARHDTIKKWHGTARHGTKHGWHGSKWAGPAQHGPFDTSSQGYMTLGAKPYCTQIRKSSALDYKQEPIYTAKKLTTCTKQEYQNLPNCHHKKICYAFIKKKTAMHSPVVSNT